MDPRGKRRWVWPAVSIVCLAAAPRAAWAWGTAEHMEIGTASYLAACAEVGTAVKALGDADSRVRARFEMACGRNLAVIAKLYGDMTAIAGDYVGHPTELLSPEGAWRFSSRKHYFLLALENSSHFNPMSTQTWREYHEAAVDHALVAAAGEGLPLLDGLEQAVRESAFADHLLQDSFAAGHMGFNRRASSAAAAKRFHDEWNERGRLVFDRNGDSWTTYGDGRLDDAKNEAGRRHVVAAATMSIHHVMLTFVSGKRHPEEGLAVWRALPFTIEAPTLLVDAAGLIEGRAVGRDTGQTPLVATVLPARKNTVVGGRIWAAAPFWDEPTVAAAANVELAVPVLPAQTSLGAGGTLNEPGGGHSLVLDFGILVPLGLSVDGLLSHEVEASASLIFLKDVATVIHAEYQGNLELGTSIVSVHLGLAEFLPARETGWYAGLGYGVALSAAGGGSF